MNHRKTYNDALVKRANQITVKLKEKLIKGGVVSDKILQAVIDKYTKDFREPIFESKMDEILSTKEF
jgi:hypothetical protein